MDIQVGNGLRDLADSVNYIDPIYIDENDLMGGDDFEEVDAPRSSTTEKKDKELADKLAEYKTGDTITVKVYRDDAFASQMGQTQWDMTDVGKGNYVDLTVTLRVIDDMQS